MTEILAIGVSKCLRPAQTWLGPVACRKGNRDQAWRYKLKLLTSEPQETAASQLANREIQGAQREDPRGPPSTVKHPPSRTHHGREALKQGELTLLL